MPSHVPYFRFYPADFANGVRGLTAQEVGVYTMLLCLMYEESGPIRANMMRLSTYCGVRGKAFEKVFQKLVDLDKIQVTDGMVSNRRAMIEIQNRADDLKKKSKAGDASAKKRKENNEAAQQAFNHTDTDTDTDIGGGGSAGAPEEFREKVLVAMGHDASGLTANGKIIGNQGDFAAFRKACDDLGISQREAITCVSETAAGKRDGPAISMSYFIEPLRRYAGARDAPPIAAVVPINGQSPPPQKLDLRAMLSNKTGSSQ